MQEVANKHINDVEALEMWKNYKDLENSENKTFFTKIKGFKSIISDPKLCFKYIEELLKKSTANIYFVTIMQYFLLVIASGKDPLSYFTLFELIIGEICINYDYEVDPKYNNLNINLDSIMGIFSKWQF